MAYLFSVIAIVIGALVFSRLRRRALASPRTRALPSEPLREVHDWRGDRVEIVVERGRGRAWVGRVVFRDESLVWEEFGTTAREAYHKAFEFFLQACPDHECGPGCGPPVNEQEAPGR